MLLLALAVLEKLLHLALHLWSGLCAVPRRRRRYIHQAAAHIVAAMGWEVVATCHIINSHPTDLQGSGAAGSRQATDSRA
jgi:hypothetical protein